MTSLSTPELLRRYDRPGPRYTSYPTAPVWRSDLGDQPFLDAVARLTGPASVYVHLPFCAEQCTFCGCNMLVAGRRDAGDRYLEALDQELEHLQTPANLPVVRIHLGGGTPTWFDVDGLRRLFALLDSRFRRSPGMEISVEIDPEITTDEQVDVLSVLGVTRLSLGVQSFDPVVLRAVNRPQRAGRIEAILARARMLGMRGLNIDLLYGLPHQTPQSWSETLDRTIALRPDRLAVFGYAHVPWLKAHQRKMDPSALPDPAARLALAELAQEKLETAGYVAIGFDHYARPDDELAGALRERRLHRNFMGYTTLRDAPLLGIGMSGISELPGLYAQVQAKLPRFYDAVFGTGPLVEKSLVLTREDALRRDVIADLLCNLRVDYPRIERRHDVSFVDHFADALESLAPMEDDGLVIRSKRSLEVTEEGRILVRNVAMAFDAYLAPATGPKFSQTI
jgi:oxygen-independent coproporphyrinogen III oxidase